MILAAGSITVNRLEAGHSAVSFILTRAFMKAVLSAELHQLVLFRQTRAASAFAKDGRPLRVDGQP